MLTNDQRSRRSETTIMTQPNVYMPRRNETWRRPGRIPPYERLPLTCKSNWQHPFSLVAVLTTPGSFIRTTLPCSPQQRRKILPPATCGMKLRLGGEVKKSDRVL
uniref:(northern house mosquito) hypothetical protein n=1 Tax=Culex pipiens TaxID=7175 RepID=A0A8D8KLQ8_CULPI